MKNLWIVFALLATVWVGCDKDNDNQMNDDGEYKVNITIEQPIADAVVAVNTPMEVKVNISRGEEEVIHHVKIYVLNSSGEIVSTLLDEHAHVVANYTYDNANAYTPTATGAYKIQVKSHDMEGGHADPVEVNFTVN